MKQLSTMAIVLTRVQYGEADRILTLITPDHGKVRLIAKGVRKPKSKLAGAIELFSVNHISVLLGRTDLGTLVSGRVERSFSNIVTDIDRTMYGYEVLKCIHGVTEDEAGAEYFTLLEQTLAALNDTSLPLAITSAWFDLHMLGLTGHQPNLQTDLAGKRLAETEQYMFSYDDMSFAVNPNGPYDARHIKLLRLAVAVDTPRLLAKVSDVNALLPDVKDIADTMRKHTLRV